MAKAKKTAGGPVEVEIESTSTVEVEAFILGTTPLLYNRMSEKGAHELLLPAPKKNAAEKAMNLKHRPYDEYRASVYRTADDDSPTRLVFPGGAFRKAIATAALDMPGSSKAQIGRLVRVLQYNVQVFGTPRINCQIVRQADIKKTPDVRTRAVLPEWCCRITIRFAHPLLKEKSVMSLLAHAGDFIGVGDGRNEKGSSLFCGCFTQVTPEHEDYVRICREGGRAAQDDALEHPVPYDLNGTDDTRDLLGWFDTEIIKRDHPTAGRPIGKPSNGRSRRSKEGSSG